MAEDSAEIWVVLFRSIHHVIAAEEVFQEYGLWCDLTPVPRDLSSDCGMAIEFRQHDLAAVRTVLADPRVRARDVYRPSESGHVNMTASLRVGDESA